MSSPAFSPAQVPISPVLLHPTAPDTLVEFKQAFTFEHGALSLFETHTYASQVSLHFGSPVVTGMIAGKKVMHLPEQQPFAFYPGETVVMAAGGVMTIDFPEATQQEPTKCLAIEIGQDVISQGLDLLNDSQPRDSEDHAWTWQELRHLPHNRSVADTVNRLLSIWHDPEPAADVLAKLAMQELVIRLLQTEARRLLIHGQAVGKSRLSWVVQAIDQAPETNWTIAQLADIACMSPSHFAHKFSQDLGLSPLQYVLRKKLAVGVKRLFNSRDTVSQIAYDLGFGQTGYFIRQFKRMYGVTPDAYRKRIVADQVAKCLG